MQSTTDSQRRSEAPFPEIWVPFVSEVRDILGDDGPAFGPGARRNLGVVGAPEACLGDVHGVMAVSVAQ